jgi:hypothetical protein
MRNKIAWLAASLAVLSASSALAVTTPLDTQLEQTLDPQQVGDVQVAIGPDGKGSVTYTWSSEKIISGSKFYSVLVLVDKHNKPIWSDKQVKGLRGSSGWGDHTEERSATTSFSITPAQAAAIHHILFEAGTADCGSAEMISYHCCDKGLDVTMDTQKCEGPSAARLGREPRITP